MNLKTKALNQVRMLFKNNIIERVLVSLSQNKSPNSLVAKLIPSNYLYRSPTFRLVKRDGINYKLDISDYVEWSIYYGFLEESQERLIGLCEPGYTVLDVGTNIGSTLLRFSKKANDSGCKGTVIGFEPDKINFEKCMHNIYLNKIERTEVFNIGLGEEDGMVYLGVPTPSNRGGNRVFNPEMIAHCPGQSIRVAELDEFLLVKNIVNVNLIKIDVEGYEFKVLKGAKKTIAKLMPILFIEIDDENLRQQDSSAKEVVKFLEDFGYHLYRADTTEDINSNYYFDRCHFDIIARKK